MGFDDVNGLSKGFGHTVTKRFYNALSKTVHVVDRYGFVTEMQPRHGISGVNYREFLVVDEFNVGAGVLADYARAATEEVNPEKQYFQRTVLLRELEIKQKQQSPNSPYRVSGYSHSIGSVVAESMFSDNDGVIYLEDHDVVLIYGRDIETAKRIQHPYSKNGYSSRQYQEFKEQHPDIDSGFVYNVTINDRGGIFGTKWIVISGEVIAIRPKADTDYSDGIYITRSRTTKYSEDANLETLFFTFEEKEEIPYHKLYDTIAEAKSSLIEGEMEMKLRELETKAKLVDGQIRKALLDKEAIEKDAVLRDEKHAQDMLKVKRENEKLLKDFELYRTKHAMEVTGNRRKNTLELIKYVPVVIAGVVTIASIFKK